MIYNYSLSLSLLPISSLYSRLDHFQHLTHFSSATFFLLNQNHFLSFSLLWNWPQNTKMSELSFSNTKNEHFSSNLFSIFFHFCFSIFSHPIYFSYFLFFSPYLLKLLSFLSPLFITTTLLLLVALLTFTPNLVHQKGITSSSSSEASHSKWGFFLSVLQTFLAWSLSESDDKDENIGFLNELEAYLVMFQATIFEVLEPKYVEGFEETYEESSSEGREGFSMEDFSEADEGCLSEGREVFSMEDFYDGFEDADEDCSLEDCLSDERVVFCPLEEEVTIPVEKVDKVEEEVTIPVAEVKSLESLFQENAELEDVSSQKEEDKKVNTLDSESNKVEEESKEQWPIRSGSKVKGNSSSSNNRDMYGNKVRSNSEREHAFGASMKVRSQRLETNILGSPQSNLSNFGSMRVEKEWRRTLACKLFEERHNAVDGSEGMDMLWETYETESNKVVKKSTSKKGKKNEVEKSEDEEEEEEEIDSAKLCCLQALKFSTGKMNLGMGRPNLLKFSKALKGIGWLHNHVGRHGKKNNH